jgi:hypothetical protein
MPGTPLLAPCAIWGEVVELSDYNSFGDVRVIVEEWAHYLGRELLWGRGDPLIPATRLDIGPDRLFHAMGLERRHWSSAGRFARFFAAPSPLLG